MTISRTELHAKFQEWLGEIGGKEGTEPGCYHFVEWNGENSEWYAVIQVSTSSLLNIGDFRLIFEGKTGADLIKQLTAGIATVREMHMPQAENEEREKLIEACVHAQEVLASLHVLPSEVNGLSSAVRSIEQALTLAEGRKVEVKA